MSASLEEAGHLGRVQATLSCGFDSLKLMLRSAASQLCSERICSPAFGHAALNAARVHGEDGEMHSGRAGCIHIVRALVFAWEFELWCAGGGSSQGWGAGVECF